MDIKTSKDIIVEVSQQVRKLRKEFKMSQIELSERSGVSLGSIKRFESSGEISLHGLVKISEVLHCEEYFLEIFAKKQYQSIEEVINDK